MSHISKHAGALLAMLSLLTNSHADSVIFKAGTTPAITHDVGCSEPFVIDSITLSQGDGVTLEKNGEGSTSGSFTVTFSKPAMSIVTVSFKVPDGYEWPEGTDPASEIPPEDIVFSDYAVELFDAWMTDPVTGRGVFATAGNTKTLIVEWKNPSSVDVGADPNPEGAEWPAGQPVWTGAHPAEGTALFNFPVPKPAEYSFTAECGKSATVILRALKIAFDPQSKKVKPGELDGFDVKSFLTEDSFDKEKIEWTVDETDYVSINNSGVITVNNNPFGNITKITVTATSTELDTVKDTFVIKLKTISRLLDIDIVGVKDSDEMKGKGYVAVNDDDDNGDSNVDRKYKLDLVVGGMLPSKDLRIAKISVYFKNPSSVIDETHPVILHCASGLLGTIRVWNPEDYKSGGSPLINGFGKVEFTKYGDIPKLLYLEGGRPGTGVIRLSYGGNAAENIPYMKDEIKISATKCDIKLDGLSDEKYVKEDGKLVRVEPYEFSTGAVFQVNSGDEPSLYRKLTVFKPKGGLVPSSSAVSLEWPAAELRVRSVGDDGAPS